MSAQESQTPSTSERVSLWGGRFAEGPAAVMREINASIPFDKRMWRQDIAGSKAHAAMLGAQGAQVFLKVALVGDTATRIQVHDIPPFCLTRQIYLGTMYRSTGLST